MQDAASHESPRPPSPSRQTRSRSRYPLLTEDAALLAKNHGFRLFDIVDFTVADAEKTRTDDQVPSLKFHQGPNSQRHVIIEITSDF